MIIKSKNMGSFNSVLIFFIYLFILSKVSITIQYTTAQPDYVYHFCLGENYTTNSRFQTNLNLLLPSLSLAETSIINNAYYNNTVGESADTIYESLQRRPDVTFGDCQSCVEMANQEIKGRCPNSKQAIIWYEVCMLRYSNQYYFNIMQESPAVYLFNTNNVSNPDKFNPILDDLMNDLVKEATSSSSTNFATLGKHFDDFGKVYGLVQCTADMPSNTCNRCLLGAISEIPNCCDGKRGGRVIRPSCNFRYEVYPFMGHINTPSPPFIAFPAPLQPPPSLGSPPLTTNTTSPKSNGNNSSILAIGIIVPLIITVLSAIAFCFFCLWRKKTKTNKFDYFNNEIRSTESLQFNFGTVGAATNNFSEANKLGQGGFGSVYKGILSDSQEIAVKRLSKNSGQGEQEFKNEVTLVAKLQHRNLVKLVGFSLSGEEKLLIYEFMQNASLDQFLFDFGMARLFVLDQTEASTNRIVGTHGYMAPEYIRDGEFSVKSDVFSFGVLVLEILCGKRNSSFHKTNIARDLLTYAWKHWNNGSATEILDPTLKDKCSRGEVIICIHVALLCVQENVADRPTMPTVVQMLNNSVSTIHDLPSSPAFFADTARHIDPHPTLYPGYSEEQGIANNRSNTNTPNWSVNEASVTELYPR
ncbi:cysteine-rich receptor-like protein kinase 10 [Papaver somniferum]|uniref:cysteine-rich receptor-like protein kinase 10 n=1 Tax=Papaver somniferum TaxID=3469 RepID=UPI000E7047B9|nr:cysteine-rich receptor-like protein kinase 10 [Papaver somniferum]